MLVFFGALFSCGAIAQTVKGEWYGVGEVIKEGVHSSYLVELIVKQNGRKITGEFNYFFRNAEIKTKITGTYYADNRTLQLKTNPILNYQAINANGADCPMQGLFSLKVSRAETTLTGSFTAVSDYRLTCPAINIKFVKSVPETTSALAPAQVSPPVAEAEVEIAAPPPVISKPLDAPDPNIVKLNERAFDVGDLIEVDADSLKVTLYDNGEVDNDTISVFYNRKVVVRNQMLSDKPITFMLSLDTAVNEIAMYAENLGKIAPNTALAVIYAGEKRFEISLTSNFIKNSTIRFRRRIKGKDEKNIN